ncbi:ABC1 kinase family protein [Nonomuraea rubra]|uniref:ABC1 kinase family protein n=1 Tax=Nonomuraea rubra TaxID=46180 RepID=UPI0036201238
MSDLPRRAVTRSAKLATLPLSFAGRAALGLGKRIGGKSAEMVAQEVQQRTAEQVFKVLGELKGGAMKLGQALSIFEAALPQEIAGPYRATLTKLQESAPPLPVSTVHKVLAEQLGDGWREHFLSFDDQPTAAASIGQVHKAVWHDGREVAVKIQYPGAGKALLGDFSQLARLGKLFGALLPGLDMKALLGELRERIAEELDYLREAEAQHAFALEFHEDPDFHVPDVVAANEMVLVTEWMEGTPLSRIISDGTQEQRDRAGLLFVRFLFCSPARVGMLHADPHPGNFRMLANGKLGVLDFGAVNRLPDGYPKAFGQLTRIFNQGDMETVTAGLRKEGFIRQDIEIDPDALRAFLAPYVEPTAVEEFTFSREWLQAQAASVADLRPTNVIRQLNLPPSYVLIHRVHAAGVGVLCQLGTTARFRDEVIRWVPASPTTPTTSRSRSAERHLLSGRWVVHGGRAPRGRRLWPGPCGRARWRAVCESAQWWGRHRRRLRVRRLGYRAARWPGHVRESAVVGRSLGRHCWAVTTMCNYSSANRYSLLGDADAPIRAPAGGCCPGCRRGVRGGPGCECRRRSGSGRGVSGLAGG